MRKHILSAALAFGLFGIGVVQAQTLTTIAFDSGASGTHDLYTSAAKTTLLTAGDVNTAFDGAVLQLGYYTQGTSTSPFAGTFVALAGSGSANTGFGNISIGDSPSDANGDGTFALTLSFNPASTTTNVLAPTGQQLVIQFYNNTTLANSTAFNAVSDSLWLFPAPANPPSTLNMSLDQTGLVFLGGANSAFATTVAVVPEPSTYVGVLVGAALFAFASWRKFAAV